MSQKEIFFQNDKNGKPLAYRWSRRQFRSFRISIDKAFIMIATDEAKIITTPLQIAR